MRQQDVSRVDFYILPTADRQGVLKWVCRLAEKAFKEGYRILIRPQDRTEGGRLDELLWLFRPGSFIPHAWLENAENEPDCLRVWLGEELPATLKADLLINLADDLPPHWREVLRIAEIVDQTHLEAGRRKYRLYQQQGGELHTHKLSRV